MVREQVWLTLPQVVVLLATRNIELALQVTASNPDLLVLKANRIIGMRASVAFKTKATKKERRDAVRRLRKKNLARKDQSRYLEAQQRVASLLASGVSVRGSRKPGAPLKKLDPAEFTRLELQGLDARDKRTREVVFYNLLIEAFEFIERIREPAPGTVGVDTRPECQEEHQLSTAHREEWNITGDPFPALLEWARSEWGHAPDEFPSVNELLRAHRARFGRVLGISEKMMRPVRLELASKKALRGGAPTHRR